MEWINLIGFALSVSTIIVGLGSFIVACGSYKTGSADKVADREEGKLKIAA